MADRYNTPAEGTLDWHVPLNENFRFLDKDVEIRDEEANVEQYSPTDGAKFLALDTGTIYIGDGQQWQEFGTVKPSTTDDGGDGSTPSGDMPDGTIVAEPGDVQATLDQAESEDGFGRFNFTKVSLKANTVYETTAPIQVPKGVALDCNHATIIPQGDHNVLELDGNTFVKNAWIRTSKVNGYSSVGVEVGADWAGPANLLNPTRVQNTWVIGEEGNGTGVRFRGGDSPTGPSATFQGKSWKFDKCVEFKSFGDQVRAASDGDWVTGAEFWGTLGRGRIPIHLESQGAAIGGCQVVGQIQPAPDIAEWAIKHEDDPRDINSGSEYLDSKLYKYRANTFMVKIWDQFRYSNEYGRSGDLRNPVWYIGEGQQVYNSILDMDGKLSNEFIVNNAFRAETNGIFNIQGGPNWGAVDFGTGTKEYEAGENREQWHPTSSPGA